MNLDIDRLTILSRSFLQNNTLRARTLSKALEPCAHSPAGSLCTRLTDIGILGSRYYYFLHTYITGVGNPSYHNPSIMRCIKPRDRKHLKYKVALTLALARALVLVLVLALALVLALVRLFVVRISY